MFTMAFFASFISFFHLAKASNLETNLLASNVYHWMSLPIMIAIIISLFEPLYNVKNFDKLFNLFIFIFVLSFIAPLIPFSFEGILSLARQLLAVEIIVLASFLFIKDKEISSLLFLLAMICFTVAGVSLSYNLEYLSIFSYIMAFLFLSLVFAVSSDYLNKKKHGIERYFSLENKLRKTEKALKESERKYQTIVENTNDLLLVTDIKDKVCYVSPACKKVLGYDKKKVLESNQWPFQIHPDDVNKVKQKVEHAKRGKTGNIEYRIKTKAGKIKWVSHSFTPLSNDNKKILNSIRDITKGKEAERELEEKVKELRRSELATLNIMEDFQETISSLEKAEEKIKKKNKELKAKTEKLNDLNKNLEKKVKERTKEIKKLLKQKDEFISQLGHDLKTPLTPLNTLLPVVKNKVDNEDIKESLEIAIRNVNYMKNLVVKTLKLARLNSPNLQLEKEETNLLEEVNKIIENNQYKFKENDIEIKNLIDEDTVIKADKLRLEELLDNLLSNSVKYTPDGGTVTIDAKKAGEKIKVSIDDEGIGMEEEELNNIFDKFYKADLSRHDFESQGLGLPICKRIVEKHGGKIWAESPGKGKGTTFYFTLETS